MSNDKKTPKKPERKSIDEEVKKQWPPLKEPEKRPVPKPEKKSGSN